MIVLSLIGLLVSAGIIGIGVWSVTKNLTVKRTTDRYRYAKTKDEEGNEITKVIDLEDDENA